VHLVGFIVRILRLFANSTRAAIEKIIYIYIFTCVSRHAIEVQGTQTSDGKG